MSQDESDFIMVDSNSNSDSMTESPITEQPSSEYPKKRKANTTYPAVLAALEHFGLSEGQILPPIDEEVVQDIGSYTWEIEDLKTLVHDKERSPVFTVGGHDFKLLLFPKGNAQNQLALYLEPQPKKHIDDKTGEEVLDDPKWYVCAQFTLIISNPKDPHNNIANTSHQRFCRTATDWGFSNFMETRWLFHSRAKHLGPLLFEERLNITAHVKVLKDTTGVLWHNFIDYDSKKETGFVGFRNQGATCYLNSLLQSYFFTKSFRNAVYQIPTEGEKPTDSVPLALQRIFYQLQRSDEAIDTSELTKSFGWDNVDSFTQHDVQELNRVLMDKLEDKMKGTPVENMLKDTFVGKMKSYIKCINVDYESARLEDFWDIQMNVKNMANLQESFQNYIEVETLDGENQYDAGEFGRQDAKKGVIFTEFPKVLHLQLKRFEYDFNYDALIKVNDRYEFPESIDLSPFLDKEDVPDAGPCVYDLHGVLVHAGDIANGHYYAMIKPDSSDKWYRFDDDKVWKVTKKQVFEENFGINQIEQSVGLKMTRAQQQAYMIRRQTSAYMLVYIKRSEVENVLAEVGDDAVPKYITDVVEKELEELKKKRKEEEEQHLYLNINFYTHELFQKYQGFDLGAESKNTPEGFYLENAFPHTVKALKEMKFKELFPEIKELTGVEPETSNFWNMPYRRNHTLRPAHKMYIGDMTVLDVYSKYFSHKQNVMNMWIEEPSKELTADLGAEYKLVENFTEDADDNLIVSTKILIFLKYFDAEHQSLKGFTHVYVNEDDTVGSIIPTVKAALDISDEYELDFFEEVCSTSIEKVNPAMTFYKSELGSGDILTVQTSTTTKGDLLSNGEHADIYPFFTTAPEFYHFMAKRRHIQVQPITGTINDDEFVVTDESFSEVSESNSWDFWVPTFASYSDFATMIGKKINKDPAKLRIYVNYSGNRTALRTNMHVGNFIPTVLPYTTKPLFEYEFLKVPLALLEQMTALKIHWLPNGYCHYTDYEFLVSPESTTDEVIDKLQAKVGFSDEDKAKVVLWTNTECRFERLVHRGQTVDTIEYEDELFGAVLPEESEILEKYYIDSAEEAANTGERPMLTPVLQFHKDPRNLHGISFVFALYPGEKFKDTRERLQQKMGLGQREFAKVSVCLWDPQMKSARVIKDDEEQDLVLFDQLTSNYFLCLNLADRTSRMGNHQGGGIQIR